MKVGEVVAAVFSEPQRCYGHCEQPATFRLLESDDVAIACYACPGGYVSKVMVYGRSPTLERLRSFLLGALGEGADVSDDDLRVATRHPWDLKASGEDITASYWTQNYRRTKSEDPDRRALFICSRCGSLFRRSLSAAESLCQNCAG
ncbi:MAG: hypothetical protein LYZ69_08515 [Nitrososphaerales archaeon]|nr:hypothetical protein [Nitrososphaerales archaeon]